MSCFVLRLGIFNLHNYVNNFILHFLISISNNSCFQKKNQTPPKISDYQNKPIGYDPGGLSSLYHPAKIAPAMYTHSILSGSTTFPVFANTKPFSFHQFHTLSHTLGFCIPKPLLSSNSIQFQASYKSPKSFFPTEHKLTDADEAADEYDDDIDDDDDEEAADEYDDVSGEVSDEIQQSDDEFEVSSDSSPAPSWREEFKWQRVEKLCNEVKEFGNEMIDVDELASIYDFRIDKFQVYVYLF